MLLEALDVLHQGQNWSLKEFKDCCTSWKIQDILFRESSNPERGQLCVSYLTIRIERIKFKNFWHVVQEIWEREREREKRNCLNSNVSYIGYRSNIVNKEETFTM